eukprot:gene4076-2925_t
MLQTFLRLDSKLNYLVDVPTASWLFNDFSYAYTCLGIIFLQYKIAFKFSITSYNRHTSRLEPVIRSTSKSIVVYADECFSNPVAIVLLIHHPLLILVPFHVQSQDLCVALIFRRSRHTTLH